MSKNICEEGAKLTPEMMAATKHIAAVESLKKDVVV